MKKLNPITESSIPVDPNDTEVPFEIKQKLLEVPQDFETTIYTKPKKQTNRQDNPFLIIRGKLPPCIILPKNTVSVSARKKAWENHRKQVQRDIENNTTDVIEVPKTNKKQYIRNLDSHQKDMLNFFLSEIAPLESAFDPTLDVVQQMLEIITKSEIDMGDTGTFRAMLRDVINMKTLEFFSQKAELSEAQKKVLVDKYFRPKV